VTPFTLENAHAMTKRDLIHSLANPAVYLPKSTMYRLFGVRTIGALCTVFL